jgi:hypothetical protein
MHSSVRSLSILRVWQLPEYDIQYLLTEYLCFHVMQAVASGAVSSGGDIQMFIGVS